MSPSSCSRATSFGFWKGATWRRKIFCMSMTRSTVLSSCECLMSDYVSTFLYRPSTTWNQQFLLSPTAWRTISQSPLVVEFPVDKSSILGRALIPSIYGLVLTPIPCQEWLHYRASIFWWLICSIGVVQSNRAFFSRKFPPGSKNYSFKESIWRALLEIDIGTTDRRALF